MKLRLLTVTLIFIILPGVAFAQEINPSANVNHPSDTEIEFEVLSKYYFEQQIEELFSQRGICQILWVSCYVSISEASQKLHLLNYEIREHYRIKQEGIRNLITILESDSLSGDSYTRNQLMALRKKLDIKD
ncbi:MAG: hypothetical protein EA390_02960 [Balneolaceae bacterium]|nr:MAG: hypothetical protein EA390_02960 [Balneolaceae bacterium]